MKRYGYLYHQIYDIENLRLAHKNARKGKTHYKEVKIIDKNLDEYLYKLQELLINKTFNTSKYEVFLKEDKGKIREIYKLPYFPDRIVQHAIMQVLEPIWKPTLIKNTYQSIKGRGIHQAKKHIEEKKKTNPKYCLKFDIKKFYPSINNEILKSILRKKIKDQDTLWLLDNIVDSSKGVPIGNYISQYFGNLYLSELDHYLKEKLRIKLYYRYCDDFIILGAEKNKLRLVLDLILIKLSLLKLKIKQNYQIFPILKRGIDFIGFRFYITHTLLRKGIFNRAKKLYRNIFLSEEDFNKRSASYNGWFKHCNCLNLSNSLLNLRFN